MKKLIALVSLVAASTLAAAAAAPKSPLLTDIAPRTSTPVPPGLKSLSREKLAQTCAINGWIVAQGAYRTVKAGVPQEDGLRLMGVIMEHLLTSIVWLSDAEELTEKAVEQLTDEWQAKSVPDTLAETAYCKEQGVETYRRLDDESKADIREAVKSVLKRFHEDE